MSMNGRFRQLSPRALQILLERPELIHAAVTSEPNAAGDDPLAALPAPIRAMAAAMPPERRQQIVQQHAMMMDKMKQNPAFARMLEMQTEEAGELRSAGIGDDDLPAPLSIGKLWHGLHYLLSGHPRETSPGAGEAVLGGRDTPEDTGYGAVRVMTSDEAAAVADGLAAVRDDELLARFDPAAMTAAGLYGRWEDDEDREELGEAFHAVRDYYAAAKARGYGMLLAIV